MNILLCVYRHVCIYTVYSRCSDIYIELYLQYITQYMLAVHVFEAYAGICYVSPDTWTWASWVLDQGQTIILHFDFLINLISPFSILRCLHLSNLADSLKPFGMLGMARKCLWLHSDTSCSAPRPSAQRAEWSRVERSGGQECVLVSGVCACVEFMFVVEGSVLYEDFLSAKSEIQDVRINTDVVMVNAQAAFCH